MTGSDKTRARGWRWQLLRRLARWPRARVAAVLALPMLGVVTTDLALRGSRLLALPPRYLGSYGAAMLESATVWGTLLVGASARRGWVRWPAAASFVALSTLVVGGQIYFYRQYSTYLNLDATLFGTSLADSVFGQLGADGAYFGSSILPAFFVSLAIVWLGRRLLRTRRRTARAAIALTLPALFAALLIPCSYRSIQGSTPDVIYFHAIGGLMKQLAGLSAPRPIGPKRRSPPALPPLAAAPAVRRNVLFVLTEAVRADVACSAPDPSCAATPFTNAALPHRAPLLQMRSTSSATAIQLAVLWSGLQADAGREPLHHAPVLFDYANAAGYQTAYWTSHHMMFANSRLWVQDLPTRFRCGATDLDPLADIDLGADDRLLTARVEQQLPQLEEPYFAVVHYGNTHVPYLIDPHDAPFTPYRPSKAPDDNEAYRRYYENAVYYQDRTIAELVRFVRARPAGDRTVILLTSDHGEQFREHGQLGHTGSVFDAEIHVPAWIDAPPGALTDTERSRLVAWARQPTSHLDITPTVLDLLGLWRTAALRRYTSKMDGRSLIADAPDQPPPLVALSNCAGVWGCAFANWGVMRGWRKLHAREQDRDWLCYDVEHDPGELYPLASSACMDLRRQAVLRFGGLPGRR